MKARGILPALALALGIPAAGQAAPAGTVSGHYAEFRNADIYTGPCFANAEVGLTGEEAVLAWHVDQGAWSGVPLEGLSVVAVVRASATLGDPFANPLPAKTVFIVDSRANDAQQTALVHFAQSQTAGLLNDVVAIEPTPISFAVGNQHGFVSVEAGNLVQLSTRSINAGDQFCHNEELYYPPLAAHLVHAMPAAVIESAYRGNHLGVTWDDSGRRSSFVGAFSE